MNKILLLCLISLSLNANTGPAINPKHPDSTENCVTYFPYDEDYNKFYDDLVDQSKVPKSESDCVDFYFGINMIKDIMTDAALSDSKLMEPCILDAPF